MCISLSEGKCSHVWLQKACEAKGQAVTYKLEEGYDHSYYFISTFVDEHIEFHAKRLASFSGN